MNQGEPDPVRSVTGGLDTGQHELVLPIRGVIAPTVVDPHPPIIPPGGSMPKLVTESIHLEEAVTTADSRSGRMSIQVITPGWGSSGYYSPQVCEAAAPLFTVGTQMFLDHPTQTEQYDRPVRSVRDIAAIITEDAHWDDATQAVIAECQVTAPFRELLTDEHLVKNIGLSIRGSATDIVPGEAEGRRGGIIESLADVQSVDFVTRAGRGGKVLQVLESARFISEATADDRARQLSDVVRAAYPDRGVYAYVMDMDAERQVVWFQVSPESGPATTYEQTYDVADNDVNVTLTGDPIEVARVTTYVPVTRPDSNNPTTEETVEVTMGNIQIDEAQHRDLVERAGRVDTLESERDTAVQRAETAERTLAESTARTTATDRAHARVVAANAVLAPAAVDRIVAEATRTVPLTDAGQLDEAALDTAVDTARTTEEVYLASITGGDTAGGLRGFGQSAPDDEKVAESKPTTNAWGRPLSEIGA